jgi:hypothetical protein
MEKLILLGIAMWFSFGLTDGFPPPKPIKKPDKQKTEISKPDPSGPSEIKFRWIKTNYE